MSKLPGEVWILGHRFTISNHPSPTETEMRRLIRERHPPAYSGPDDDVRVYFSNISFRDDWITIEPRLTSEQMKRETLLHEITHGVDHMLLCPAKRQKVTGVQKPCAWCEAKAVTVQYESMTEEVVMAFSRGLFATLTDPRNREVRDFIFGDAR